MSNLIPEQRTDKNGVTSTKWVKPSSDSPSAKASIPKPVIGPADYNWAEMRRDANVLSHALESPSSTQRVKRLLWNNVATIGSYLPEMIPAMKEATQRYESSARLLGDLMTRNGGFHTNGGEIENETKQLRIALAIIPALADIESQLGRDVFSTAIEGIRLVETVGDAIDAQGTGEINQDHTVALAMISFIRGDTDPFNDNYKLSISEVSDDLDFIANNLEEVQPLVPELNRRMAYDKETIESLMSMPSKSLSSGML